MLSSQLPFTDTFWECYIQHHSVPPINYSKGDEMFFLWLVSTSNNILLETSEKLFRAILTSWTTPSNSQSLFMKRDSTKQGSLEVKPVKVWRFYKNGSSLRCKLAPRCLLCLCRKIVTSYKSRTTKTLQLNDGLCPQQTVKDYNMFLNPSSNALLLLNRTHDVKVEECTKTLNTTKVLIRKHCSRKKSFL